MAVLNCICAMRGIYNYFFLNMSLNKTRNIHPTQHTRHTCHTPHALPMQGMDAIEMWVKDAANPGSTPALRVFVSNSENQTACT